MEVMRKGVTNDKVDKKMGRREELVVLTKENGVLFWGLRSSKILW
jgi:hypothetical protein